VAQTRIISIVGKKNAGKTTLAVALASEYVRKGRRVMGIKHGSHPADVDRPGSDSYRLFHEGKAERVLIAAPNMRAVFERSPDDTDPIILARRYFDGADIVIVEGFKSANIPKIEVYRREASDTPFFDANAGERRRVGGGGYRRREVRGALPRSPFPRHHVVAAAGQHRVGESAPALTGGMNPSPLTPRDAAIQILEQVRPQPPLRVPLDDALDGVLAEDIISPINLPAWDNSAMDGYAVRSLDTRDATPDAPARLRVVEQIPAGHFPTNSIESGTSARIFTGAPVPRGADAVVRQEDTDQGSDSVAIGKPAEPGQNVRRAGEDIARGSTVLLAGTEIGPAHLGVLASLAVSNPMIYRRPRVAILSGGDEIADIDQPDEILSGRKIASSNSHTLAALVRRAGGEPVKSRHCAGHAGEPSRAPGSGARLRSHHHHRRHQRRRARLHQAGAGRTGRRAPLLAIAHASRRSGRLRHDRRHPLAWLAGQSGEHDGDLRTLCAPGHPETLRPQ
jgi:molybdopterin molybdotransferase